MKKRQTVKGLPSSLFALMISSARTVFAQTGRLLNAALAGTGQLALVSSLLFWVGMLLS